MPIEIELVKLKPNDKGISNLKQYKENRASRGYKPGPGYTGGFPVNVKQIIRETISGYSPVLHLYSGRSDIGDVRIDLECPEATEKISVEEFLHRDGPRWSFVILDPPYKVKNPEILRDYADARPLSGNTLLRDRLCLYLRKRADNVLWLDYCSPEIKGFQRHKLWLMVPPKYFENVRVMTWLKRTSGEMML